MESTLNHTFVDHSIEILLKHKKEWAQLLIAEKVHLLKSTLQNVSTVAEDWVSLSVNHKKIDPKSQAVGEIWGGEIWGLAATIQDYILTLNNIIENGYPSMPRVSMKENGQMAINIFPANPIESLLMHRVQAEVWMQPHISEETLPEKLGVFYQLVNPEGIIALVLGAGNNNAIPLLDSLYSLIAKGEVVLLKLNPVNDYMISIYERVMSAFIEAGYLQIIKGDEPIAEYLVTHDDLDEILLTGSYRTYNKIINRLNSAQKSNSSRSKPVEGQLGSVTPLIVIPGNWSKQDLAFQAENIISSKLHNSGHNCISTQILVLPKAWNLKNDLIEAIRNLLTNLPARKTYYPGTEERYQQAIAGNPQVETFNGDVPVTLIYALDPENENEYCFKNEVYAPVLGLVELPSEDIPGYFRSAVNFCNQKLFGNLGCTLIIDSEQQALYQEQLEWALQELQYGTIGVNIWNAFAFLLPKAPWGPYPDSENIQSGNGVTHNALFMEGTEKTILKAPFRSWPHSFRQGEFSLLPRHPWMVNNRYGADINRKMAWFALEQKLTKLPGLIWSAMRG